MKKILLILFFFLGALLFPADALAICEINPPDTVTAGETFTVQTSGLTIGLNYTLSYRRGAQTKIYVDTNDSPKKATESTLSFSLKLDIEGIYQFVLRGRDNSGEVKDACLGDNDDNLEVIKATPKPGEIATPTPIPWRLFGGRCLEDRFQGTFQTKEECEAQLEKQGLKEAPTPTPPPPPCTKFDSNGNCTEIDTALKGLSTNPGEFVKQIFGIVLSLAGGVSVILIILSGYRLLSSGGNPEKLTAAKEQLVSAIVGLLFIIFSLSILQIIGVDILHIPDFMK